MFFDLALPGTLRIVSVTENGNDLTRCSGPFGGRWECRFSGLAAGQTRSFDLGFVRDAGDTDPGRTITIQMSGLIDEREIVPAADREQFAIIV